MRRRLHGLRRLVPAGPRRRLSSWLRGKGFKPDAHYTIRMEYPTSASNSPRWNPHPELERIIARGEATYRRSLETIASYRDSLLEIEAHAQDPQEPRGSTTGCLPWTAPPSTPSSEAAPALYLEIGSGISTRFAARARRDGQLDMRIVSIDPEPRADVEALCDRALRVPLELADLSVFDELSDGDVVFLDGSHRTFMNSDATVFFLELLPRLAGGVLVGVHDVFLPYDYPAELADRYYSEQYLLAAHLLGGNRAIEPSPRLLREP